jgi:hypothetical protein
VVHSSQKPFALGLFAIGLSLATFPAQATTLPGLTNLNFLSYSGTTPKGTFTSVNPTGWTGGTGLIFIDTPGDATNPSSACGSTYLQTAGCPSTLAIAGGYNYVEADGNPSFASGFSYALSGLTAGTTYELSFYQAASQQLGFSGATTEQWIVSLGTSGLTACAGCLGGGNSSYANADATASIVATNLMNTPSQGMVDWNYVTVNLTADAADQVLSFLAWGNNGNTANNPPIVFLAGVNSEAGLNTPEPGTVAILGCGLLALGIVVIRRRRGNAV